MVEKKRFFFSLMYFCNFSYGEDSNVAFFEEVNPNLILNKSLPRRSNEVNSYFVNWNNWKYSLFEEHNYDYSLYSVS